MNRMQLRLSHPDLVHYASGALVIPCIMCNLRVLTVNHKPLANNAVALDLTLERNETVVLRGYSTKQHPQRTIAGEMEVF